MQRLMPALAAGLVLAAAGCSERQYRAETLWHADGRVTRTVMQHEEDVHNVLPWETAEAVFAPTTERWAALNDLRPRSPLVRSDRDQAYLRLRGEFAAAGDLPETVRIPAADGLLAARLEQNSRSRDLGFVTLFHWRETLTDVVTFADMAAARREAAEILTDLVLHVLAADGEFDLSELATWLRTRGTAWLEETHATYVELALQHPAPSEARIVETVAAVARRYGLRVHNQYGILLDDEARQSAIAEFIRQRMRETVRTPEGNPPDEATVERLLDRLTAGVDESPEWQSAIRARFGDGDDASAKAQELVVRLFGVHHPLSQRRVFRYEMTVPGTVLSTTGELAGPGRVRWNFRTAEAFPLGYRMECRSALPNAASQRAVLGEVVLTEPAQLAEFVALLEGDPALEQTMRLCIGRESLTPLRRLAAGSPGGQRERARALLALLQP